MRLLSGSSPMRTAISTSSSNRLITRSASTIRMVLADRVINLLEEEVDIAVRIGELPDSSLIATRVGLIRRVVCGSPAYFAARGTPKRPAELGAHDCITFDGRASPEAWTFRMRK